MIKTDDLNADSHVALIFAGVRAAALASHVLAFSELTKEHQPEMAKAIEDMARAVLRDWGIVASDRAPTTPAPESATLIWPPPPAEALLPPVYTENYYHVRQDNIEVALRSFDPMSPREIGLSARLVFMGKAVWREEPRHWLMLMEQHGPGGKSGPFWIRSSDLIAGDEIPENER